MQDTSDERKSLGMRRCKSAMLARELPPTETAVRRTTKSLMFDEDLDQIVIEEVLYKAPSRLRRCKSAADQIPVASASDEVNVSKLPRCKSYAGGMTAENDLDDDYPYKIRRCESAVLLS